MISPKDAKWLSDKFANPTAGVVLVDNLIMDAAKKGKYDVEVFFEKTKILTQDDICIIEGWGYSTQIIYNDKNRAIGYNISWNNPE